jgi:hypothetical protein
MVVQLVFHHFFRIEIDTVEGQRLWYERLSLLR